MNLKNIYYRYRNYQDRKHVIGKLEPGPTPFFGKTATILGGGSLSERDTNLLSKSGVDLALNQSFQKGIEIRNIVFELPTAPYPSKQPLALSSSAKVYLDYLRRMKDSGSKLYYRPSFRDSLNGMYEQFENIADYYSYEQRYVEDNKYILDRIRSDNNAPTPYYRYSIFLAIWWAVSAGCKEIHLYGFELPHSYQKHQSGFQHKTLDLHKGENAYTLLYKLWIELMSNGIEIKMDERGALTKLTGAIRGCE